MYVAGVIAPLVAASALGAGTPASSYVECQQPTITGVEVTHLVSVSSATACAEAMKLFRWEAKAGNIRKLYGCPSLGHAVLRMRTFDGWSLRIARSGYFEMSRAHSSFYVTGTDFPLSCT